MLLSIPFHLSLVTILCSITKPAFLFLLLIWNFLNSVQIVERRKVISTIKDSVIPKEQDLTSDSQQGNSSNADVGLISEELEDKYSTGTYSNRYNQSKEVGTNMNPSPASVHRESLNNGEDHFKNLEDQHSVEHAVGSFREGSSESPDSGLPPFLSQISQPSDGKDENFDDLAEGEKQEAAIEEKHHISPPSVWENVMNVILVAAECAPWSKTGIYGSIFALCSHQPFNIHSMFSAVSNF